MLFNFFPFYDQWLYVNIHDYNVSAVTELLLLLVVLCFLNFGVFVFSPNTFETAQTETQRWLGQKSKMLDREFVTVLNELSFSVQIKSVTSFWFFFYFYFYFLLWQLEVSTLQSHDSPFSFYPESSLERCRSAHSAVSGALLPPAGRTVCHSRGGRGGFAVERDEHGEGWRGQKVEDQAENS